MKVFFFWERAGGLTLQHRCNPYAGLLARALVNHDIHLELGDYDFSEEWLESNRADYEVLHLHWLHHFYRRDTLEETERAFDRFSRNLQLSKDMGYRVIWTIHNLYPHERPFPQVDVKTRLLAVDKADAVIAHCGYAAKEAGRLFHPRKPIHVIPHGNFIDAFPNDVTRSEARGRLGIDEKAFVYLFFGNARSYKGVEHLIDAFLRRAGDDARLVLMMRRSFDAKYADQLAEQSAADDRVMMFTDPYFPESEFQVYINASDIVVFPFNEVLTSGSAIAALSFGKPVVVPRLGCLPELVPPDAGLLYDAGNSTALEEALLAARKIDLVAACEAAMHTALELDWESIAEKTAALYRGE